MSDRSENATDRPDPTNNGDGDECENISCHREAEIKVAFGTDDPFYRVFCEPHARRERGRHDDATYADTDINQGEKQ